MKTEIKLIKILKHRVRVICWLKIIHLVGRGHKVKHKVNKVVVKELIQKENQIHSNLNVVVMWKKYRTEIFIWNLYRFHILHLSLHIRHGTIKNSPFSIIETNLRSHWSSNPSKTWKNLPSSSNCGTTSPKTTKNM